MPETLPTTSRIGSVPVSDAPAALASRGSFCIGGPPVKSVELGADNPILLIAGPCVIESRDSCLEHAERLRDICKRVGVGLLFKSSYDKANRTSLEGYRGVGIEEGLRVLAEVRREFEIPVVTDVHRAEDVNVVASEVDVLQVPAFLCRQTDLLLSAGACGLPVLIKKGQFLHPSDMRYSAEKVMAGGCRRILLCERGTCFGYRELVVDFRSLPMMSEIGIPLVFDATHSVQVMGGAGGSSSGSRRFVSALARAAVAVGIDALFLECHVDPDSAPSDGSNMLPMDRLEGLLSEVLSIEEACKRR